MSASWSALHAQLLLSTTRYSFMAAYRALRGKTPELKPFPDPSALFAWLHGPSAPHDEKNDVLRTLVNGVRRSATRSDLVTTILILALWPGLDAVYGRLRRHFPDAHQTLAAEISARAVLEIRRIDLTKVNWIAATVIRNIERDLRRELRKTWDHERVSSPIEDHAERLASSDDPRTALNRVLAVQMIERLGDDAALVRAVAVEDLSTKEAAGHLGISHEAARKQYQRALHRVRTKP